MTLPEPDITIDVDLRNPGQFFACCGLLELASRLWPASADNGWQEPKGWFDRSSFHIATYSQSNERPLQSILRRLVEADPLVEPAADAADVDDKIAPLILIPFGIRLDWWLKPGGSFEPGNLKLWSGNQKPMLIFNDLKTEADRVGVAGNRDLLKIRTPMTGRFGVDPSPAWDAIDVGFSPNDQKIPVLTSPATEFLASIGLQGFIPTQETPRRFLYAAWSMPLPIAVARAAAGGTFGGRSYRFAVNNRGKYKAFGFAEELQEKEQ